MARVPYSGGRQREREGKRVEPRPGGTQNINKATHEGTGRPRGELEPWQKSELCGCSCSQTLGKGKTMRESETSASPLPGIQHQECKV